MGNLTVRALVWLLLGAAIGAQGASTNAELRGIWMHATQIKTPAETEQAASRIAGAHLNAVFLLVWYWGGQAFYKTDLCAPGEGIALGYDPLGAMVEACHARGIEVHAWFVNGEYGAARPGSVLSQHPDWAVNAGGNELWYDFGKAAIRKFESDLMIGCRCNALREAAFVLNTTTNLARYGNNLSAAAQRSFSRLGYKAKSLDEAGLETLA
jgi:uncharacterized lipoprotein YddW (UPF0748 family)